MEFSPLAFCSRFSPPGAEHSTIKEGRILEMWQILSPTHLAQPFPGESAGTGRFGQRKEEINEVSAVKCCFLASSEFRPLLLSFSHFKSPEQSPEGIQEKKYKRFTYLGGSKRSHSTFFLDFPD